MPKASRKGKKHPARRRHGAGEEHQREGDGHQRLGAWLPWRLVEALCRLKLKPPSRWQVLMAIVATACRYGSCEARLTVKQLAEMTGLSKGTVQHALRDLAEQGLIRREGRYGKLLIALEGADKQRDDTVSAAVGASTCVPPAGIELSSGGTTTFVPPETSEVDPGGTTTVVPPRYNHGCTSPTRFIGLYSNRDLSIFSPKQLKLIDDVMTEATELLGGDAGDLPVSDELLARMDLESPRTYSNAFVEVAGSGDPKRANAFVRAVLALRRDDRVQGQELLA